MHLFSAYKYFPDYGRGQREEVQVKHGGFTVMKKQKQELDDDEVAEAGHAGYKREKLRALHSGPFMSFAKKWAAHALGGILQGVA